jgi:4-hydroxyproline epimerase
LNGLRGSKKLAFETGTRRFHRLAVFYVFRYCANSHPAEQLDMTRIRVIDTHTGGEPTRVVVASPIDLGCGTMAERRELFAAKFDDYRKAIVCEPRGSDVMVGALLVPPENPASMAGVIFFNNVGCLGMCGHGMIGVAIAFQHMERVAKGIHQLDTPVGPVQFEWLGDNRVRIQNVPSYRFRAAVPVKLPSGQTLHGDIAWGGNWFFICQDHGLPVELRALGELQRLTSEVRRALNANGICGEDGGEIDHIELIGPPSSIVRADARNYVLCPGGAYDRSPCGTGTSAKVACLAADGKLAPNQIHRQESIVGSLFEATYTKANNGQILPSITGAAYVNGEADLILDARDPFCMGISAN